MGLTSEQIVSSSQLQAGTRRQTVWRTRTQYVTTQPLSPPAGSLQEGHTTPWHHRERPPAQGYHTLTFADWEQAKSQQPRSCAVQGGSHLEEENQDATCFYRSTVPNCCWLTGQLVCMRFEVQGVQKLVPT